jgi:hypothetical protein
MHQSNLEKDFLYLKLFLFILFYKVIVHHERPIEINERFIVILGTTANPNIIFIQDTYQLDLFFSHQKVEIRVFN